MILTYEFARSRCACAVLVAAFSLLGCQADNEYRCGTGTCDPDTEICLIGGSDQCSTCVPRPAACDSDVTCGCVPAASDASWGNFQCDDEGTCSEAAGGLVLTCDMPQWGCG